MDEIIQRITLNPDVCNGKPTIRNMRFTVTQMLELLASGMSQEEILEDYPYIEREDIQACLLYAAKMANAKSIIAAAAWFSMLKFIVDTHLPPGLAQWLVKKGYDATHPYFLPPGERMTDTEIRQLAVTESRIIITKDTDFFDYYLVKGTPPKVLLLEFGNIKNKLLLAQFEAHLSLVVQEFEIGAELLLFNYGRVSRY